MPSPQHNAQQTGWLLLSLGVLCNPWLLTWGFSSDGHLHQYNALLVLLFDGLLILPGIFLLWHRKHGSVASIFAVLRQERPRLLALWLGCSACVLLVLLLEGSALLWLNLTTQDHTQIEKTWTPTPTTSDANLGYRLIPSQTLQHFYRIGPDTIWDVTYHIDQYGKRQLHLPPAELDQHLLFMGGSFAFGYGLADSNTLAYRTRQAWPHPATHANIYGVGGYGPQQVLLQVRSPQFTEGIYTGKGFMIYQFNDLHVRRATGSFQTYTLFGRAFPYFELEDDDRTALLGNFRDDRQPLSGWYELLAGSNFIQAWGLEFPVFISEDHIALTAALIRDAAKAYETAFPNGRFVVMIHPGSVLGGRLITFLEQYGIAYLDYSTLYDAHDPAYFLHPSDQHPNAHANRVLGKQLAKDVQAMVRGGL